MSEQPLEGNTVYWPRVKEILDDLMARWEVKRGRRPLPGIHRYYWDSPEQLANDVLSGIRAIEPGVPGRETAFVRSIHQALLPKLWTTTQRAHQARESLQPSTNFLLPPWRQHKNRGSIFDAAPVFMSCYFSWDWESSLLPRPAPAPWSFGKPGFAPTSFPPLPTALDYQS